MAALSSSASLHHRHLDPSLQLPLQQQTRCTAMSTPRLPSPLRCCEYVRRPTVMAPAAAESTANAPTEAEKKQGSVSKSYAPLQLTYLEGNSWLWNVIGLQLLVDPVLVGNLDFGIPWLYDASKKELKEFQLEDLPELDLLLITQNFDDHCHKRTLEPLSRMFPDLQVISTPNAKPTLSKLFKRVIYLEPGHSTWFTGSNGSELTIRASAGPVLGPPWQRPENGYFVEAMDPTFSIYYEPHCVYNHSLLQRERADVVITPVIKQVLPLYTLVSGQKDAVDLVRLLQGKIVVPLQNGDLESKGILAKIVASVGTVQEFRPLIALWPTSYKGHYHDDPAIWRSLQSNELLQKDLPNVQVLEAKPGIPLDIPVAT